MNFNSAQNRPCYSIQSHREENLSLILEQVERPATVIIIPESIKLKALSGLPTKEGETNSSYQPPHPQSILKPLHGDDVHRHFHCIQCGLIFVLSMFS